MKTRLSLLYFIQFSVWGCYLTCFGQLLGSGGLGHDIAWFYAAIGLVSILTPTLFGRLADKTGRPERLLGICHLAGAAVMFVMWRYGMTHTHMDFRIFFPLYICFLSFYMPTMALANTATFGILAKSGRNTVTTFPAIRIWGTVGFVTAMWFVNCAYWRDGGLGFAFSDASDTGHLRFQYNAMQLLCSGVMGLTASLYSFTLPRISKVCGNAREEQLTHPLTTSLRIMFGKKKIVIFLLFVAFSGVCLQISNGFVTPFITHFIGFKEYAESFASGNATMLFSLSQIAEAASVLLVGIALNIRGIRGVYAIGLLAWSLRFLFLGFGNPTDGLWLLIGSMLVYGIAFNFITVAGHIYIQQKSPSNMKGFAQGLMMFMSNGIGATFGTLGAGVIVNRWCHWEMVKLPGSEITTRLFIGDWQHVWIIFASYAFIIMMFWLICSRKVMNDQNKV